LVENEQKKTESKSKKNTDEKNEEKYVLYFLFILFNIEQNS